MLKGAQKRMVVLRMTAGSLFETAYFVLRDDARDLGESADDSMLREANRIIAESFSPEKKGGTRHSRLRALLWLLAGVVMGAAIATLVLFIFSISS